MTGHRGGALGPHGPNAATELEAALAADLLRGSGGAEPPQLSTHGAPPYAAAVAPT